MWKDTATRVFSALVGLTLLAIILFMNDNVLRVAVGAASLFMLFEFYHAFNYGWTFTIIGSIGSLIVVAVLSLGNVDAFMGAQVLYIIFLIIVALSSHKKTKFSDIAMMLFATIYITCFMSYIARIKTTHENGIYFMMLIFVCAWVCDSGAYFCGKLFGKHKLIPAISPKKTVEGAIGGIICSAIGSVIIGLIAQLGFKLEVNYLILVAIALIGAILGIMGDLIASLMKRQCGVKDFGNIMPGHGGLLDRFDSVILVAPFIYYSVFVAEYLGTFIIR